MLVQLIQDLPPATVKYLTAYNIIADAHTKKQYGISSSNIYQKDVPLAAISDTSYKIECENVKQKKVIEDKRYKAH